ncbi:MAG: hypothetical protein ACE5SW_02710 [Nitrososphaeraceae archaeon]
MQSNYSHNLNLPLVEENKQFPLMISVVLKYWGEDNIVIDSKKFQTQISLFEGLKMASKKGFSYFIYKGSLLDIKKRIDQAIPPIVIFPGLYNMIEHAILVSGYNTDEKRIMTYIPKPDTEGFIPESKFEMQWRQEDNVSIIMLPNDMEDIIKKADLKCLNSNMICFEAENEFLQGNIDSAIKKLNKVLNDDNENARAWSMLGSCFSEKNDPKAVACFEKAISINSYYFLAFRGLGNFFLKNEDYKKAEEYYSNAIVIDADRYGPIYKNRAFVRLKLNKNSEAKEDLLMYLKKTLGAQDKKTIEDTINSL